jgi:hypothetical protein
LEIIRYSRAGFRTKKGYEDRDPIRLRHGKFFVLKGEHMSNVSRRTLITRFGTGAVAAAAVGTVLEYAVARQPARGVLSKAEWMAKWMDSPRAKDVVGQLWLGRFLESNVFFVEANRVETEPDTDRNI